MNKLLDFYKKKLNIDEIPEFMGKYLNTTSLKRLEKIGYFCGMDYASKDIYSFKEYITRYDHSITVALLTWKLTKNKKKTLSALYHDIATPCFSHAIDYMNKDYETQESTEENTEVILEKDAELRKYLLEDSLTINDIANFKKYSIVDNSRPKLCADRLDGIILTGISWTKNIEKEDIENILAATRIYTNEDNEEEIGFNDIGVGQFVLNVSNTINYFCHSKEDFYMMNLLASIVRKGIEKKHFSYDDLYKYSEIEILSILEENGDSEIKELLYIFKNIKKSDIGNFLMPNIKNRYLNPLVLGKRLK